MTSYLGPDNPTPTNLISEQYQYILPVGKCSKLDDKLYDFGDGYYENISKLLWLQGGINVDDHICLISSIKSRLTIELEKRLNLIYPIVKLVPKYILYQDLPDNSRDINVGYLTVGAEDYFSDTNSDDETSQKFNKIIICDGMELIIDRLNLLYNIKRRLKDNSDSNLIILHRTSDITTLPFYDEILNKFETTQIDPEKLLQELIELNMLVGWGLYSIPFVINRKKWFNQLYNHYPSPVDYLPLNEGVYQGLRQLVDTSFKYTDSSVCIKDTFLLLIACESSGDLAGQPPYHLNLLDNDFNSNYLRHDAPTKDVLLRMKVTADIAKHMPKSYKSLERYVDSNGGHVTHAEEWWGTIPSISMGMMDASRINKFIN